MKTWEKPKLTVLVRGKPEEAILTNCKTQDDTATSGPYWEWHGCVYDFANDFCVVMTCSTPASS